MDLAPPSHGRGAQEFSLKGDGSCVAGPCFPDMRNLVYSLAAAVCVLGFALVLSGCLPLDQATLARDIEQTRSDVSDIRVGLGSHDKRVSSWEDSFTEQDKAQFGQLRDRLADLDDRLDQMQADLAAIRQALEAGPAQATVKPAARVAPAASPRSTAVTSAGATLSAGDMLRSAAEQFEKNKYAEAIATYQQIIATFSDSDLADDAQYGIGVVYENMKDYRKALEAYLVVPAKYPGGDQAPQARFRAAVCAQALGNKEQAILLLNEIILKNPTFESMPQVKDLQRGLGQ